MRNGLLLTLPVVASVARVVASAPVAATATAVVVACAPLLKSSVNVKRKTTAVHGDNKPHSVAPLWRWLCHLSDLTPLGAYA